MATTNHNLRLSILSITLDFFEDDLLLFFDVVSRSFQCGGNRLTDDSSQAGVTSCCCCSISPRDRPVNFAYTPRGGRPIVENLQKFLTGKFFRGSVLRPLLINEPWFIFDKSKVWEWVWCLKDWKRKMRSFDNWKRGDFEYWYHGHWYPGSIEWNHPSLIFMRAQPRTKTGRSAELFTERVKHNSSSKYVLSIKYEDFVARKCHLNSKHA